MSDDAEHAGMNGNATYGIRLTALEEWKGSVEEQIFVALGQLMTEVREAKSAAKSADATSSLIAAQFHAVHGDVAIAKKDIDAVRGRQKELGAKQRELEGKQSELAEARYRDKLESHHDIEDTQRKAVMSANEAAKAIAKAEADAVRLEHARDALAKAEHAVEKSGDRTHDYKVHGFSKGLAAMGGLFMAMAAVIAYLLTHGSPFH